MPTESLILAAGLALYVAATLVAVAASLMGRVGWAATALLLGLALAVHGAAILLRWGRLGHGPYVEIFDVLSSNVWSLHGALLLGATLLPRLRPVLAVSLPILLVLVLWLMSVKPVDAPVPVTYDTFWLPLHVWLGKAFLAIVVVALGNSLVVLLRRLTGRPLFRRLPVSAVLEDLNFRLMLLAFVFDCLMLVAGSAWAQDAWGRFWAWDPLETWAFVTWLAIGGFLHLRATVALRPEASALAVVLIFVIGFATFLGVPFVSTVPHQGMI